MDDSASIEELSTEELCHYLKKKIPTLSDNIFQSIKEHKIDGGVFVELDDNYLQEIAPLLGDRFKLKRVLKSANACRTSTPTVAGISNCNVLPPPRTSTPTDSELSFNSEIGDNFQDTAANFMETEQVSLDSDVVCTSSASKLAWPCKEESVCVKVERLADREGKSFDSIADKDWAKKLTIPIRFSTGTMKAIENGILTQKARVEIVSSMSTLALVHTTHPTPDDLTVISRRLIEKHPNLRDKVDNGYSSWRRAIRTKFKNLRRPNRASKAGIVVLPPSKEDSGSVKIDLSTSSRAEYERHISFLQRSFQSKKWTVASMTVLMEQTSQMRQLWIRTDGPSVKAIIEKFPCLADVSIMTKEFCQLTKAIESVFNEKWANFEKAIFQFTPLEEKRAVKKLLCEYQKYKSVESDSPDCTTAFAIQLLCVCLGRAQSHQTLLTVVEGESVNIDEKVASLSVKAPSIIAFGETRGSPTEFRVIIEDNVFIVPTLITGLHYCFASYYVFNISFPNEFRLCLLFLEKYVYSLKSSSKVPLSVSNLFDSVSRF